jgi:hypothetical protein
MQRVDSPEAHLLMYRHVPRRRARIVWLVLLVGPGALLLNFGLHGGNPWLLGFGAALVVLGTAILDVRSALEINTQTGTYVHWVRCLVPLRIRRGRTTDFECVELHEDQTDRVYYAYLEGRQGPIGVGADRDYEKARAEAEQLAETLGLPLERWCDGYPVAEEAMRRRESLRRRRRFDPVHDPLPEPPASLRTQVRVEKEVIVFHVPPARKAAIGLFVIWCVGLAAFFPVLSVVLLNPAVWSFLALAGVVILLIVMPLRALYRLKTGRGDHDITLTIRPEGLKLAGLRVFPKLPWTFTIPAEDLLNVQIRRPRSSFQERGVLLWCRGSMIGFGGHLPPAEQEWIKAVIERVVKQA